MRIRKCTLIFHENIRKGIDVRGTFGLPNWLEWGRHTRNQGKIDLVGRFMGDEMRIRKQQEYAKQYECVCILE